jgi:hypothetical protein
MARDVLPAKKWRLPHGSRGQQGSYSSGQGTVLSSVTEFAMSPEIFVRMMASGNGAIDR